MNKILTSVIVCLSVLFTLGSCDKAANELPPSEFELGDVGQDILAHKESLVSEPNGWFFRYKPSDNSEEILIVMRFDNDGKMFIQSSTRSNLNSVESSYVVDGKYIPAITFSENSVFKYLSEKLDGARKFNIKSFENGRFTLVRADGYTTNEYYLEPLTPSLNGELDHKIDSLITLIEYERIYDVSKSKWRGIIDKNTGLYRFKNIVFDEFGAMFTAVDTVDKWIEIEFMTPYVFPNPSYLVSKQRYYYDHTVEGIVFDQPIIYNGITIPEFIFEDLEENRLIISTDGATSTGYIGYDNYPGYYYQDMQDFFINSKWSGTGGVMVTKSAIDGYFTGDWIQYAKDVRTELQGNRNSFEIGISAKHTGTSAITVNKPRIQLWTNAHNSANTWFYFSFEPDVSIPNRIVFNNITFDPVSSNQNVSNEKKETAITFINTILGDPEGFSLFIGPPFSASQQSIILYSVNDATKSVRFVLQTSGSPSYNVYRDFSK